MNKNIIVLVVMAVLMFLLVYFYALPQWRKYHPKAVPMDQQQQQQMPGMPGSGN